MSSTLTHHGECSHNSSPFAGSVFDPSSGAERGAHASCVAAAEAAWAAAAPPTGRAARRALGCGHCRTGGSPMVVEVALGASAGRRAARLAVPLPVAEVAGAFAAALAALPALPAGRRPEARPETVPLAQARAVAPRPRRAKLGRASVSCRILLCAHCAAVPLAARGDSGAERVSLGAEHRCGESGESVYVPCGEWHEAQEDGAGLASVKDLGLVVNVRARVAVTELVPGALPAAARAVVRAALRERLAWLERGFAVVGPHPTAGAPAVFVCASHREVYAVKIRTLVDTTRAAITEACDKDVMVAVERVMRDASSSTAERASRADKRMHSGGDGEGFHQAGKRARCEGARSGELVVRRAATGVLERAPKPTHE
jgi:hypothetical protein